MRKSTPPAHVSESARMQ